MKEVVSEILKKINEKNLIWFALTFFFVLLAILLLPSMFSALVEKLNTVGISKPYSTIMIFLFYGSISFLLMRPISSLIEEFKKSSSLREKKKLIKKLGEDEFHILMHFAVFQDTSYRFPPEYTHKARLLEKKGLLYTGFNGRYGDGSETFFLKKDILNFLTEEYHDQIDKFRTAQK